ncbi:MAG: DUF89 family protein [Chlorobi bacterium]|nr:DUF89 family protein [Chlorobiota bacterium]
MKKECFFCHTKTVEKLIQKFNPADSVAEEFLRSVNRLFDQEWDSSNPYLATKIHRMAKEKLNIANLYEEEKLNANKQLLKHNNYWRTLVNDSSDPFRMAAKLAVIGNVVDYGAHSLNGDDVAEQIKSLIHNALKIDDTGELHERIKNAESVLYIGDNAGEIVLDKLFIEVMNHSNVTFAVRGYPVINDITEEDAKQTGIDRLCKVISNGYDAPSTLLDHCSDEFLDAYNNAGVIIAKGQGNFEGLMDEKNEKLFFLLMAKCKPIAGMLGVNKGDMLVKKAV